MHRIYVHIGTVVAILVFIIVLFILIALTRGDFSVLSNTHHSDAVKSVPETREHI